MQASETRHISLDAMRGFAVMGILAMNIVAFSMPDTAYMSPAVYGGESWTDIISWYAGFILFDGKMRGLFSLLFGASMLLVIDGAEAKGENGKSVHFRRMAWLALFGLAHFYLIWFGDILFLYAVVGCVAFLFRKWEPRRLVKWALSLYFIGALFWGGAMSGMFVLKYAVEQPNPEARLVAEYNDIINQPDFTAKHAAPQLKIHRGGYEDIIAHKWKEMRYQPLMVVVQVISETLPLMLLGMALLKNGFLLGAWDRRRYVQLAAWALPLGALATTFIAWIMHSNEFGVIYILNGQLGWAILPRLAMTMGYAALLLVLIQQFHNSSFLARVAAVGRAAFTNYLGTSILMTTIFYGYGLGLFGHVSRTGLWLFVIGVWAVMLLWSKPWLARFRYGPLEWLWRSLARMEIQPMRR